jgi:hypothetical protein
MTKRIYQTAQGKSIDLGAIVLKNEHVRAVGNMNVNARGDRLDSSNLVVDTRNQQVSRQMQSITKPVNASVSNQPLHTSTAKARRSKTEKSNSVDPVVPVPIEDAVTPAVVSEPVQSAVGGLAAAMARSKTVTQERLKTQKEIAKTTPGVQKL